MSSRNQLHGNGIFAIISNTGQKAPKDSNTHIAFSTSTCSGPLKLPYWEPLCWLVLLEGRY